MFNGPRVREMCSEPCRVVDHPPLSKVWVATSYQSPETPNAIDSAVDTKKHRFGGTQAIRNHVQKRNGSNGRRLLHKKKHKKKICGSDATCLWLTSR